MRDHDRPPTSQWHRWRRTINDLASLFIVAACAYVIWNSARSSETSTAEAAHDAPSLPTSPVLFGDDASLGSVGAPVVLIVYSDFRCPFCATFARDAFAFVKAKYVESDRVQVIFRHFPIVSLHPSARLAASAAECSREESLFWPMHDRLFSDQNPAETALWAHASALGMNVETFKRCLVNEAIVDRIDRHLSDALRLGIAKTPTLLIGVREGSAQARIVEVISGAASAGRVQESLDKALQRSQH